MEAIAQGMPLGRFQPAELARANPRASKQRSFNRFAKRHDRLARKALRAMYLGAAFHELPDQCKSHPGMQERLARHAREVDEAVFGTTELLEKLSAKKRERLRQVLRQDRALPMRVAEVLDDKARTASVPTKRRRMLRQAMIHVSFRLRRQHPSLFIDECVGKVRRVARRKGYSEELQRRLATEAAEAAFWELADARGRQFESAGTAAAGDSEGWIPVHPDPEPPPPASAPGSGAITAGLWMLGIGLGVGLLGIALVSAENLGGLFLLTAAVLLLAAGLITLIVGLIIKAVSDAPEQAEPEAVDETLPPGWQSGVPPPPAPE
jgi:hypothetical protein